MIIDEGNDMNKPKDMGVVARERKKHKRKTPKKQRKMKKLASAKRRLISGLLWCVPTNERMIDKNPYKK
jgi:hypothetical protein